MAKARRWTCAATGDVWLGARAWVESSRFVGPAHSAAALALYCQAGFRETGSRRQLSTNPALQIVAMEVEP